MIQRFNKVSNGKVGRNEELLGLNPAYRYFVGVEATDSSFLLSLVDFAGNVIVAKESASIEETDAFVGECAQNYSPIAGIGVLAKGEKERLLIETLSKRGYPCYEGSLSSALAGIYALTHPEAKNFMTLCLEGELDSSISINREIYGREAGNISYIYQADGKTLGDIMGDAVDSGCWTPLASTLINFQIVLKIDDILCFGATLGEESTIDAIKKEALRIRQDFDSSVIKPFAGYDELTPYRAALYCLFRFLY
ncbi:MAG: hypothetical protein K6F32_06550 [Bacilli bacterium]|nr:hypothetical protein [Bacilli bacterium]